MKVTVLNHTHDDIVVHRIGCRDITMAERHGKVNSRWDVDVPTGVPVATAVADDLNASFGYPETYGPDEPPPWAPSNVRVMPCVKGGA